MRDRYGSTFKTEISRRRQAGIGDFHLDALANRRRNERVFFRLLVAQNSPQPERRNTQVLGSRRGQKEGGFVDMMRELV